MIDVLDSVTWTYINAMRNCHETFSDSVCSSVHPSFRLKVGFHYPSSRAVNSARELR